MNGLTTRRYPIDPINPRKTLGGCFRYIGQEARKLERKLLKMERELEISQSQPNPFEGWTPHELLGSLVAVSNLFCRTELLLLGWEAEIRWQVAECGLPQDMRQQKISLEAQLAAMRERWLDKTGRQILHGMRSILMPVGTEPVAEEVNGPVNQILAEFFGDVMPDPKDWSDPAARKLCGLLREVGEITKNSDLVEQLIATLRVMSV